MRGANRRQFLQTALLGAAGAVCAPGALLARGETFRLNYAPHDGHFRHSAGEGIVDQIHHAADLGFRAWEDNGMKGREVSEQEAIARALADRGMQMGVFVGSSIDWKEPKLTLGDAAVRDAFLAEIRDSVEVARRVNATWMTIVPGHVDPRQDMGYQAANLVDALKRACEILEPHGLVMVLEPLNRRDHPGMFLTGSAQSYALCKAVGSPSCKILFDIYHQQISEGNLLPNIDRCWDEIAYFQVGDNPGRKEPTTGEINYRNVFAHLHARGYRGVVGMEHGKSREGLAGEKALVEAYRYCDAFA
jgi:hydroxypyruvate isomerase